LQCRALVQQLCHVVSFAVLTTANDASLRADDVVDGVPVRRLFMPATSWWWKLVTAFRMAGFMAANGRRFAMVHFHGFSDKTMFLIGLSRLMGKRIAIKLTLIGEDDPESMRARGRLRQWFYSRADVFFTISPKFEETALSQQRDRCRFIPNGVDLRR